MIFNFAGNRVDIVQISCPPLQERTMVKFLVAAEPLWVIRGG
jgi:hypothetical protein